MKELKEAIDKWNDPSVNFTSQYCCYMGHKRGNKPIFTSKQSKDYIEVSIDDCPFSVDKFSYEDFKTKTKSEIKDFIDYVNEEISTLNSMVNQLTKSIDKLILKKLKI